MCGELAIEYWRKGLWLGSFTAWERAAELLLGVKEPNDDWRIAITLLGNISGYFAHIAHGGKDESWDLAKPSPGLMHGRDRRLLRYFDATKLFAIHAQLTLLAQDLGLYDKSIAWAARARLADFSLEMHTLIVPYRVAAHLRQRRFAQPIEESWGCYANGANSANIADRAAKHFGQLAVFAIAVELARVRIQAGVDDARQAETEIRTRIVALSTGQQLDSWWQEALTALEEISAGNRNWKQLYERGLAQGEPNCDLMYRLAALMTAPPQRAFHITINSFMRELITWVNATIYNVIVVEFLREYWAWSVRECSAHFSRPPRIQEELEKALALDEGYEGLKRGLLLVADNLGVSLTERQKQFLLPSR